MKKFAAILSGLIVALVIAVASAGYLILSDIREKGTNNGPWSTNLTVGSADAGIYTKAAVAVGGLLALSKEETIYYTAFEDSDGNTLTEECTYRITGQDPDTRWWSMTIYALDNYLVRNDDNRPSIAQTTVERTQPGTFEAVVSADPQPGNWISSRNAGAPFSLTLRLYNPGESVYNAPDRTPLPTIKKEGCK